MSTIEQANSPPTNDSAPPVYEEPDCNPWENIDQQIAHHPDRRSHIVTSPKRKWFYTILLYVAAVAVATVFGLLCCPYAFHPSTLLCETKALGSASICNATHTSNAPRPSEPVHWKGFSSFSVRQKNLADIFTTVEHQPLSTVSRQMTRLAAAALGLRLSILIQTSELPKKWFVEELSNFEIVAADTAVALQDLDAQKRGAADSIVFVNEGVLQFMGFKPALDSLSFPQRFNMYIDNWRQTRPLTTVFEAAVNDHFRILSNLNEGILRASRLLREQRRRVQMMTRVADVANATLCANPPPGILVCLFDPARCKCVAHQAMIRELGAFASDAMQTISMVQADLQTTRSQIRYYREGPFFLGTHIPYNVHIKTIWNATQLVKGKLKR